MIYKKERDGVSIAIGGAATFGGTIAIVISWSINKSILWCILHGIFGWFYVLYYALGNGRS
jgi:hypothetical protein